MLHSIALVRASFLVPVLMGSFAAIGAPISKTASTAEPGQQDWRALQVPGLCRETRALPQFQRLLTGAHIELAPDGPSFALQPSVRPSLPVSALLGLLREEARRSEWTLRFSSAAPPLLAQGPADQLASCAEILAEMDAASRAFEVELAVWITPGASSAGTHPSQEDFHRETEGQQAWGLAHALSGQRIALGRREYKSFVGDYSTEVSTDSGVATPIIGRVSYGKTLHVRACRVRKGTAIHLEALLDMAEIESVETFDSESVDFGLFEQPQVDSLQVAFSGVVPSAGVLALPIAGAPFAMADFTLWIRARTRPDPQVRHWRSIDLALLETRVRGLPLLGPGAGLDSVAVADSRPDWIQPTPASLIAQSAESAARAENGRLKPMVVWSPGLLMAPVAATGAWSEVDSMVAATENARLGSAELSIQQGALSMIVPTTEGMPVRVRVGREYTMLESYDAEIAPETWMISPRMGSAFDGLALRARLSGSSLVCDAWISESAALKHATRTQLALAGIQLAQRNFRSASTQLERAFPVREILSHGGESGLRLELALP